MSFCRHTETQFHTFSTACGKERPPDLYGNQSAGFPMTRRGSYHTRPPLQPTPGAPCDRIQAVQYQGVTLITAGLLAARRTTFPGAPLRGVLDGGSGWFRHRDRSSERRGEIELASRLQGHWAAEMEIPIGEAPTYQNRPTYTETRETVSPPDIYLQALRKKQG